MRHTISVLVRNQPGVLARVAGLFSARGFNIESLAVGETQDRELSRMTIVVPGDGCVLEQVRKQLSKLIDTIKVQEIEEQNCVTRDLMLIKVKAPSGHRGEILEIAQVFHADIVHLSEKTMIMQITGPEDQLDRFINILRPFGVMEIMRTGRVAMVRD